ncbi:MAG TPA: RluA family pseudouridine synthase [Planctomycetota bacterium]|nr:RluA family pseudouridine synthase [Planctomycetota bacterium]
MSLPPDPLLNPGAVERIRFRVPDAEAGTRVDVFLRDRLPWRSRTGVQRLIREGKVAAVRGSIETTFRSPSDRVPAAGEVVLAVPQPRSGVAPPRPIDLSIVYEDEWLLAVDKPANLPVHPSGRYLYDTLIFALYRRYRRPEDPGRDIKPRLLHRIDRETSGLVLCSKDERAHLLLYRQFEGREIFKEYLALVHGEPLEEEGTIDLPLAPSGGPIRVKMVVRADGLPSLTRWRVVRRARGFALLACEPKTGRQHQVRAHLAARGYPIVGDKIYGPDERLFLKALAKELSEEDRARLLLERHALHAHRLRFLHPIQGGELEIRAPLPPDMAGFLEGLGERAGAPG